MKGDLVIARSANIAKINSLFDFNSHSYIRKAKCLKSVGAKRR